MESRRKFLQTGAIGTTTLLAGSSFYPGMDKGNMADDKDGNSNWKNVLTLNEKRQIISGTEEKLLTAIKNGADLRIYTEFHHNEHIDTKSTNLEKIKEVADFRITYVLDERWVAGIINLRQPISLPYGFGERPSMSFFLYNQNGQQAIARPYLDGMPHSKVRGESPLDDHSEMPKYHQMDAWDSGTNAPSSNFVYDFNVFKFWVSDHWKEVYSHDVHGKPLSGSIDALESAFENGMEIKVAIKDLCYDFGNLNEGAISHEVFVHCGSSYYYTEQKLFMTASHPVVRVKPNIPLKYKSEEWDFGWLMPRSDGHLARWLLDPYTLKFNRSYAKHAMRWFVR